MNVFVDQLLRASRNDSLVGLERVLVRERTRVAAGYLEEYFAFRIFPVVDDTFVRVVDFDVTRCFFVVDSVNCRVIARSRVVSPVTPTKAPCPTA